MHNRIFIEEDKIFSLNEFAHLIARSIRSLASADIGSEEVLYSRDDVYFTIVDLLGYINERTPGNFKLTQTSSQHYLIHYALPNAEKKRANKGLKAGLAHSAITIYQMQGKYPVWAERDDEIMKIIRENNDKDNHKSAPTDMSSEEAIKKKANTAVQFFQHDGVLPAWVDSDPRLRKRVDELLKDENKEVLPWLTKK